MGATREKKDIYALGEIPPEFHVPKMMHAWAIRRERHGRPSTAMQIEQVPVPEIDSDEVLVLVMAAGVNYNGIWAAQAIRSRCLMSTNKISMSLALTLPASSGPLDAKSRASNRATKS